MKDSINVAIAGSTGYVGLELTKILAKHPKVKIKYLCAKNSVGKSIYSFSKKISNKNLPKITRIDKINWKKINVIFTALPNGEAQRIAKIIPHNVRLIDLSADFRLKNYRDYESWYKKKHACINLIKESVYAVSEFSRKQIKNHRIISCPGCYPTSIQMPLVPLVQKKMINTNNIIVDSKSGYSGAGKKLKSKFKIKNLFQSVSAYGVGHHRHMIEIDEQLSNFSKKNIKVHFTPHLIPMFRGILSTIYLETPKNIRAEKIYSFLKKYHKNNFFVKIEKFNKPISTGDVMNTNYCKISVCKDRKKNKVIILSAIDNLIKGASGQAVQNMNILFNMDERTGLT